MTCPNFSRVQDDNIDNRRRASPMHDYCIVMACLRISAHGLSNSLGRLAHQIHQLHISTHGLSNFFGFLAHARIAIVYHDATHLVVLPGRSGPKRLDCERCGVALTTPSPCWAFTAVPHPRLGRCLSTLVLLVVGHTLARLNTGSETWTATQFELSHSRSSSVSFSKRQLFVVRMMGTRHKKTS